ncbi:MAG: hypothetical protein GEU95_07185 [Rhizobiales bacterium]|nr:hypothetical protein [Hyphomicrobiales bacterium]
MTLRREQVARLPTAMTDRPALRKLGKTAEKWRILAEKRREDFAELFRSGRWQRYYELDDFVVLAREVAEICDRWTLIVEQYRLAAPDPEAPTIDRNAA